MYYVLKGATKAQKKIIDDAMSFAVHFLNIPSNVETEINVSHKFDTSGVMLTDDQEGFLTFEMEIKSDLSDEELELTVYHEMKHIEQISSGVLSDWKWYGRDHSETPYMQCPWEIEAYDFEKFAFSMKRMLTSSEK